MKKLSLFFIIISILLLSACSNSKADQESTKFTEAQNESLSAPSSESEPDSKSVPPSSNETDLTEDEIETPNSQTYNNLTDSPDEISLMSYAQTVLENFYPNCKYSRNKNDYNFVNTDLRFKIEGEVSVNATSASEDFYMIIQFLDENFETYDLISLQIGNDIVFESGSTTNTLPSSTNSENDILSEENAAIYNAVMEQLNSDYTREEDEIFEEIAPYYGMTSSELKQFMYDYMEAYYQ